MNSQEQRRWVPYPYQRAVERAVKAGKNVILQAPTGAGKTWAALRPFLHHVDPDQPGHPDAFPLKCIYSIPMRVLASQFDAEYRKQLQADYPHQNPDKFLSIRKQTGEHPNDPRFEAALIFATIDQTLSSFLHIPYGLSRRQANLNAGAVIGSYLVFDEVHLYPPDSMLPTTLAMLRMLRETTPFILMTATFSRTLLEELRDRLNEGVSVETVVIPNDIDEDASLDGMLNIDSQKGKKRVFHYHDRDVTPDDVVNLRGGHRRTLVICNTVDRAQEMHSALADHFDGRGVCVMSLHSRFLAPDRQKKEKKIRDIFETEQAKYSGPDTILVATQVVEVGLDITSDVLISDLAPASSLLQRAGRCARRRGESGVVHVFLPQYPDDHEKTPGEPYYAPYGFGKRGLQLCENTREALLSGKFSGRHMDFSLEQDFIDVVHTPVDQDIMDALRGNENNHLTQMLDTMAAADFQSGAGLIRDVDATSFVFLYNGDPNEDDRLLRYPWAYEGFSLRPWTIQRGIEPLIEMAGDDSGIGPIGWYARPLEEHERDPEFGQHDPRYEWVCVWDIEDLPKAALAIAVNPEWVSYDGRTGLHFSTVEAGRTAPLYSADDRPTWSPYAYHKETYVEHIEGLMRAYTEHLNLPEQGFQVYPLRDEVAYAVRRLEDAGKLPLGAFDRMARLIIALHDVGKLSEGWQAWAHEWQADKIIKDPIPDDYMAAHTRNDADNEAHDELAKRRRHLRPNHAAESAIASLGMLDAICDNDYLYFASLTAIVRHHSATHKGEYDAFRLNKHAYKAIAEALEAVDLSKYTNLVNDAAHIWRAPDGTTALDEDMVEFVHEGGAEVGEGTEQQIVLYSLLARMLRLADQRSQM